MFAQHPGKQGKEAGREGGGCREERKRGKKITLQQSQAWFPRVSLSLRYMGNDVGKINVTIIIAALS